MAAKASSVLVAAALLAVVGCGAKDEKAAEAEASAEKESQKADPDASANKKEAAKPHDGGATKATNPEVKPPASASDSAAESSSPAEVPNAPPVAPVKKPESVLEDVVRVPATADEAAAVLDLRKLPVPADVERPALAIATAYFTTKTDEKTTFDAIAKFFADGKWKVYSEVQSYPGSISAGYAREGFRVAVSVFSGGGQTNVSIHNLGNVNLARLPVPPGAKSWHAFPDTAAFITDAGVEETRAAMHKLLGENGWQSYGGAADTRDYKQNATTISVRIHSPPATPGQTVIDFGSQQLSVDLPAPPDATRVDYSENPTQIYVESPGSAADAIAYNQRTLTSAGWKATTENPIEDGSVQMQIFRNAAKDMLTLTVREARGERPTNYMLEYLTGEQVARLDELAKKQIAEREKKRKEAEAIAEAERNKPKPMALIALPAGAKDVETEDGEIKFKVAFGEAKAAADAIVKDLEADGWKSKVILAEKVSGHVALDKDKHSIRVTYVDAGSVIPAQVTVSSFDIGLKKK